MADQRFYYVLIGDQQVGPMAVSGLRELVGQGRLAPTMLTWTEGMENWAPIAETPLADELFAGPTPPPRPAAPPARAAAAALAAAPVAVDPGNAPVIGIGFLDAIKLGFRKFATFQGRASRSEYWWFMLFYVVATCILILIPIVGIVWTLAMIVPTIAVTVRRLHDGGRSGWFYLLTFVPLVGIFIMIYFMVQPSQPEANVYG